MDDTSNESSKTEVRSPFEGVRSSMREKEVKSSKKLTWLSIVFLGLAVVLVAAVFFGKALNNPLRTLKSFPVEEYYNHSSSLEGTRFKATLRAAGQIGWNKEIGRLVNFKVEPSGNPIVALLPPKFDSMTFESGETFEAELLVAEGGLVTVNFLNQR